ncbi:winged helix-turn-helix transcriptional regulator [Sneathiella aquimaris]|uniref:winged helix-turn-helix transcriptional regulator n=1 Tax=Sneathiella aquimaris TaxID=2599305 RepID=UPI00146DB2E3|nr:helix-turn-helix domain-containing protein [Sneathiella aquimaris]
MSKKDFKDLNCSIAQTLDQIGEHWTFMILRNAFMGIRRFEDFQQQLSISPTVLSQRLKKLTENDILEKRKSKTDGRSVEYKLTEKGLDIYPILIALMDWGEKYAPSSCGERLLLVDRQDGKPIGPVSVLAHDGRPLTARDVQVRPGNGADEPMIDLVHHRRSFSQ